MLRPRRSAREAAWRHHECPARDRGGGVRALGAEAALAGGDPVAARRWADEAVTTTTGFWLMLALTTRARVAIAQGEPDQAERDGHDALAIAASMQSYLDTSDTLECLGTLAGDAGSHPEAARLFGAAHAIRQPHRRGSFQDLGRRVRSLGGGAARRHGRARL